MFDDPDVIDLLDALNDVLEDGIVTTAEKDDLSQLLSDFLEFRDEYDVLTVDSRESIKRSTGLFAGISADEKLSDDEVYYLMDWLHAHEDAREHWPLSSVYSAIQDALSDGVLDGAEKEYILMVLFDAVGGAFSEDGAASGKITNLPLDDIDNIDFDSKVFCFSGTMQ